MNQRPAHAAQQGDPLCLTFPCFSVEIAHFGSLICVGVTSINVSITEVQQHIKSLKFKVRDPTPVEEGQPRLTSLLDILVNPKPVCHVSSAPSAAGSDSRSTPNVANNHSVAVMSARQCPCNNRMIRDQNLNAKDAGMKSVEADSNRRRPEYKQANSPVELRVSSPKRPVSL